MTYAEASPFEPAGPAPHAGAPEAARKSPGEEQFPAPFGIFSPSPASNRGGAEPFGENPVPPKPARLPARARFRFPSAAEIIRHLEAQHPVWLWIQISLTVVLIGLADYMTGYEISVVLFYSVPILLMVRFADKRSAVFVALLCSIVWWWADEASGHHYTSVWHQTWETLVRLGYFLLFVVAGSAIKSRFELFARSERLEQEIIRISEREQRRIGQDLHDGICQYFAAIGFTAGAAKGRLERAGSPEAKAVGEIQDLILSGVQETRALARGLFPVQNDEWGLPSALSELAGSTSRLLDLKCTFASNATTVPIPNGCCTHLFRIAQESLSNAARHGHARNATIGLTLSDDQLVLSIEDDGRGFGHDEGDGKGLGLTIMQYRARQMGAEMTFTKGRTGGAMVACLVPLPLQSTFS